MIPTCIHGFPPDQCASCRTCQHGFPASRCGRCRAQQKRATRRSAPRVITGEHDSTKYHGFEIFFAPAVNGWRYRAPDSTPSELSYRSVFLARKAIDEVAPADEKKAASGRRR